MGVKTMIRHLFILCSLGLAISDSSELESSHHSHSIKKRQSFDGTKRVVCYFANWSVYRSGTAKFTPQNINPYLCTHLIYAFGGLGKDDTIQPFDKYQDLEKGGYGKFAALKTYNRDLKTLLAIGGWNEGSRRFSPLVADPSRRRTFIKSAIRFLRQYNFDGLDLDWEYPSFRDGGKPEDRKNYAKFVAEMRDAFESEAKATGKDRLLITMAVPASLEYAGKGFDIESLDRNLDFFNLLTYDYHSSYEPSTNHHSPLFRPNDVSEFDYRSDLNIDTTVKFYIKQGASRDKLVLGIPTYGRSYQLVNPDAHEIGSPTDGPGKKGPGTKEDGYLAYYEICEGIQNDDWDVVYPNPGAHGPYAHTKEGFWVGYDDEDIAREKAYYVSEEGLGGIMFWTIDNDDFRAACSLRPFPLIESAKEALFGKEASFKTATSVSISTSEQTRVERLRLTQKQLAQLSSQPKSTSRSPATPRPQKKQSQSNSESVNFDPFNTPAPPTTPSSAPAFECKDEGFFPHSSSCKKYFWCLEVPAQGMIAHTFTCPTGLYFNSITDGCDFRRNVDCEGKDDTEVKSKKTDTTTESSLDFDEDDDSEEQTVEQILEKIKNAGGLEAFEENLRKEEEEKEAQKRKEEERRQEISTKTRNNLSRLLDRKRAEVKDELRRNEPQNDDNRSKSQSSSSKPSNPQFSSKANTVRTSLLSRLAEKRKQAAASLKTKTASKSPFTADDIPSQNDNEEEDTEAKGRGSSRSRLFKNRTRFNLNRQASTTENPQPQTQKPNSVTKNLLRGRDRFRNLLNRKPETDNPGSSTPSLSDQEPTANVEKEKFEVIGDVPGVSSPEEDDDKPVTLRPNRFRPQSGIRERLRTTLERQLEREKQLEGQKQSDEFDEEDDDNFGSDETFTLKPLRTRTDSSRPFVQRQRVPPTESSRPSATERKKPIVESNAINGIANRGLPPNAVKHEEEEKEDTKVSNVRNLQYVTIDRGNRFRGSNRESAKERNRSPTRDNNNANIPFRPEDDEVTSVTDAPLAATSTGRNLEYVTIQRGRKPAPPPEIEEPNDIQEEEADDEELKSVDKTTNKPKTWPTLPPPPPTTTTVSSSLFDLDTDTPSDSASLLFLTNPNLIPDDEVELEQQNKDDSSLSDEDVEDDIRTSVKNRNRILQNLSGRSRRPFLQRRPPKQRKPTPLLPTTSTTSTTQELITEQLFEEDVEDSIEDIPFQIPLDNEFDSEPDLNIEEQLFANILQQGQAKEESVKSFRGRQQINNSNPSQRGKRPKSIFSPRNRNTLPTRTSPAIKSRPTSSAINDIALRNRQRSRSRLRTRPGSVAKSNNRVHPFSTTTKAPTTTTTQEQTTTTTRFEIPSVPPTINIENIFPIDSSELAPVIPVEVEPREQFPLQPAQDTFVTRARAPVERLIPTTPASVPPSRARAPVSRVRQTTTPKPFSKIVVTEPDYEEYYEYYDEEQGSTIPHPPPVKSIDDYDLFPLNNKVDLDGEGNPICHDVGVFPHPTSCRMFITCSRRTVTTNVVGWVYECPSYLAFDPVGGRCNWASDVVCT